MRRIVCSVLLLLSWLRSNGATGGGGGEVPLVVAGVTAAAAAAVGSSSSSRLRGHQRRSLRAATTTVGRIKSPQQQQSTALLDRKRFYKEQVDDTTNTTTTTTKKKNSGKGPQQHPSSNNKNNATRRPANNESSAAAATATTTSNQETQQNSSSSSDESELRSNGAVVVQKEEIITVPPGTRYKLNLHSDLYQNSNTDPNTTASIAASASIATHAWEEDISTQIYIGHEIVENSNSSLVKIEMVRKHDTAEYGTAAGSSSSSSTSSIHVHIANGSFDNTGNNNNTVTIRMLEEDDGESTTDGNATHPNPEKNPLRGPNNSNGGGATIVQVGDQHYDTYIYEYATPVDKKYIKLSKGGYGERFGRVLRQVRFNKIPPILDNFKVRTSAWRYVPEAEHWLRAVHTGVFPLLDTDYPLLKDNPKVHLLRSETMADSVTLPGDYQLHGHDQAGYWLQFAGGGASSRIQYPGAPGGTFWDEFRHVVQLQIARRNNSPPSDYNHWPGTFLC